MASRSVAVVMGSDSDREVVAPAIAVLDEFGVPRQWRVLSAHRTPEEAAAFARGAAASGVGVIIAAAGGAAHLPGVLAAHTVLPVIGLPVRSPALGGLDSLLSMAQMPPGVPVGTVGIDGARNAGLLAVAILALAEPRLADALGEFRRRQAARVLEADARVSASSPGGAGA
jgi:5-(carboxyamino)imidazole ribonucleotide mutase